MGIFSDWYVTEAIKNLEEIHLLGTDASYAPEEGKIYPLPEKTLQVMYRRKYWGVEK